MAIPVRTPKYVLDVDLSRLIINAQSKVKSQRDFNDSLLVNSLKV